VLHNPGILTLVCQSCQTTLIREEETLFAGERSIVGEPRSSISVGATGKIGSRMLRIVGRVRFEGRNSTWDEWYGQDEKGRDVWLVEDEKRYSLEHRIGKAIPGTHPDMALGDIIEVGTRRYQVDELGSAICLGGEGQLPRGIHPGSSYRFVDLTEVDGIHRLSLEFDASGEAEAFIGKDIPPSGIDFGGAPAPSEMDPVVESKGLNCPSCGGSFTLPTQGDPALTATCPYCDSVLSLEGTAAGVLSKNTKKRLFPLEIGDSGKVLGREYEVIGRMVYRDRTGWRTREYLLWGPGGGYLWLEEEAGNYIAYRPTRQGPSLVEARSLFPKQRMSIAGKSYRFYSTDKTKLEYVDGALPWLARVGDEQTSLTFIDPPWAYCIELSDGSEMERFTGQHIPPRELLEAIGQGGRYTRPSEAGIASPNPIDGLWKTAGLLLLLFSLGNVMVGLATYGSGYEVASAQLPAGSTSFESTPFTIVDGESVMGIHINTSADNSWVYVETEIVDVESDASVGGTGSEVSYYHGYEGGESWSEGSRSESRYFRPPPAGTYQVTIDAEWDVPSTISVSVTVGDKLGRYPLVLALMMALGTIFIGLRWRAFERDRWDEDEDD
jgi:hypothetical protein